MVEWIGVPINNDSCEKVEGSNSKRLIFIRAENEAMESRIDARLTENNGAMDRLRADMGEMRQGDHPVDGRAGAGRCRLDHRRPWDPDSLARAAGPEPGPGLGDHRIGPHTDSAYTAPVRLRTGGVKNVRFRTPDRL